MSRTADAPLTKITMNIYARDYDYLKRKLGQGYSEKIREWIHTQCYLMRLKEEAND